MKANELKVTDLMVGDLVICYHPSRPQSFERVSVGLLHTLDQQEHGHIKEDSPLFRIVQPIPLIPEILEKNGFELDEVMKEYCMYKGIDNRVILHNDKEYMNSVNNWDVHIDSEDYCTIANCELTYVHELQHILRLCKIDKEMVV